MPEKIIWSLNVQVSGGHMVLHLRQHCADATAGENSDTCRKNEFLRSHA